MKLFFKTQGEKRIKQKEAYGPKKGGEQKESVSGPRSRSIASRVTLWNVDIFRVMFLLPDMLDPSLVVSVGACRFTQTPGLRGSFHAFPGLRM